MCVFCEDKRSPPLLEILIQADSHFFQSLRIFSSDFLLILERMGIADDIGRKKLELDFIKIKGVPLAFKIMKN